MRAVWWRELRELLLPGLGAGAALWALGGDWAVRTQHPDRVALFGVVGGGLGLFQGLLDRRRRDDGFLLHRPASALRIHAARGLAGLTWLLVGALAFAGGLWYERQRWASSGVTRHQDILSVVEGRFDSGQWPSSTPRAELFVLFGLVTAAAWAAARFGVTRRRPVLAVLTTGIAVLGTWSFVARTPDVPSAVVVTGFAAVAWFTWGLLDLAGARR